MITSKVIKMLPKGIREKLENNNDFKKIVGNINWLTFENILRNVIGLVIVALLARYLGPTASGEMNYAYAFVTLFSAVATLGLDNIFIRDILNKPKEEAKYLGSGLILKFIGSILTIIISLGGISLLEPGNRDLAIYVIIISSLYIFKSFDVIDFWFQSRIKSQFSVYARSAGFIVVTILKILFIVTKAPLLYFILTYVIETLVDAVMMILFYVKEGDIPFSKWKVDKNVICDLLTASWPLMLGSIASLIYMKVDQVMIGKMLNDTDVGIYYAAVKLSETWYFIPTVIATSVYPAILNAKRKSEEVYKQRLQILFDFSTWMGMTISVLICIFSPWIIKIMYGSDYAASAAILSVHIWSGVFVFSGLIASKWVVAENYVKNALLRTSLGALLNIGLNWFLLPRIGVMGAAIATLISYSFVNFFSMALWKKTRVCFRLQLESFNLLRVFRVKKILYYIKKKVRLAFFTIYYSVSNRYSQKNGLKKHDKKVIVSLTSYPKRFPTLYLTLESLLNQTEKPDEIILWISKEEGSDTTLPNNILKLKRRGLKISYVDGNIKSYKKLYYSLKEYSDCAIITVDDDTIYPRNLVKEMYSSYLKNEKYIIANRCTYIEKINLNELIPYLEWRINCVDNPSYNQFPTGVGGVLYPPGALSKEVFNKELFSKICPSADDVWFKAMGLLNGTKTFYNTLFKESDFLTIKSSQETSLWKINVEENKNDIQIKKVFEHFNLYEIIK